MAWAYLLLMPPQSGKTLLLAIFSCWSHQAFNLLENEVKSKAPIHFSFSTYFAELGLAEREVIKKQDESLSATIFFLTTVHFQLKTWKMEC